MRSIESFYKANMESTKKARNTHKSVVTYIPYFVSIDCSSWIDSSDTNLSAKKKKKKTASTTEILLYILFLEIYLQL